MGWNTELVQALRVNNELDVCTLTILGPLDMHSETYTTEPWAVYTDNFIYFPVNFEECFAVEFVPRHPDIANLSSLYLIER